MKTIIGMMGCAAMVLRSPAGAEGGALTAPLGELEFQNKVLGTQKSVGDKVGELTQKFDNLDKETKKAFEELTQLKNKGGDFDSLSKALQKVELQMSREKRLAFGSPVERITNSPEMKASLNAVVRHFASMSGDLQSVAKDIIKRDAGENSGFGSTLLVPQLLKEIYDSLAQFGIWNTFGVRRMGTKITQMPVKTARASAAWLTTEGQTITEDSAKAGTSVNLQVYPIASIISISMQLLQDSEFDVTADVMDDFIESFNETLDYTVLQGDGTADAQNGGQTGAFNAGTAVVAASGHTKVAGMSFEDITACLLGVDPIVLARKARWWMHPFVLVQMLSIKDDNGRPIFLTAFEAPTVNALGSILGYPVTSAYAAPAPVGVNVSTKCALFGDPNAMVVGMREDFAFEFSDHYKWANYERSFRGVGRAGVACRKASALAVLTTPAS
jgi:HK97 family phage major capsid protein